MVVEEIAGVLKGEPLPMLVPPDGVSYQFKVTPALPVAPKATDTGSGPHSEPGVVVKTIGLLTITVASVDGEAVIGEPPQEITHLKSVEALTPVTT